MMVKFLVSCRACQRPVMLTARISDPELAELREHLRTAHPAMRLPPSPGVEETLQYFRVEPESGLHEAA
ncbi:MAG: hypothetical protein E6J81_08845 [Deltaproteobacteria bacterium]|nr:MAG: hypothetical protein E6J81_08845 [Deltaproteobacteria bacterium]TMA82692.1 MAG: hypothetical protein E6J77_15345 [Deltaproteobacteria bacterium]